MLLFRSIGRRVPLERQDVEPPIHHTLTFAEEPVAADVDAVALVIVRLRDATDGIGRLENDRMDIRTLEKFIGCSESCGPGSGNDSYFWHERIMN